MCSVTVKGGRDVMDPVFRRISIRTLVSFDLEQTNLADNTCRKQMCLKGSNTPHPKGLDLIISSVVKIEES